MKEYGMIRHFVPLVAPVDEGNNSWASPYVDLSDALECTFQLYYGVLTGGATTATLTATVEASSAGSSNASEVQIPFNYRVSSVTGVDTWGAVTAAAAAAGQVSTMSYDGMMILIEVDPAVINALNPLGRWVRVVVTKSATMSVALNSIAALIIPRHASTNMQSSS